MCIRYITMALALSLFGCATAPQSYSFEKSKTSTHSYDEVWENITEFFASHNIPVKNIAKDSGVIYAETTRFGNDIADCGSPGIMIVRGRQADFNVFVKHTAAAPTVTVNSHFTEVRAFEQNVVKVECNSKGVLEREILSAVGN